MPVVTEESAYLANGYAGVVTTKVFSTCETNVDWLLYLSVLTGTKCAAYFEGIDHFEAI